MSGVPQSRRSGEGFSVGMVSQLLCVGAHVGVTVPLASSQQVFLYCLYEASANPF